MLKKNYSGMAKNMTKKKKPEEYKKRGRPTVMTPEVIGKLQQAFALGETDENACIYAGIEATALYDYQKKNPDFTQKKQQLKLNPILKAKNTIYKSLDDPKTAQWFLERKRKDEFSTKSVTDITAQGFTVVVADSAHQKMIEDL